MSDGRSEKKDAGTRGHGGERRKKEEWNDEDEDEDDIKMMDQKLE